MVLLVKSGGDSLARSLRVLEKFLASSGYGGASTSIDDGEAPRFVAKMGT
jgi:hypothetical protein